MIISWWVPCLEPHWGCNISTLCFLSQVSVQTQELRPLGTGTRWNCWVLWVNCKAALAAHPSRTSCVICPWPCPRHPGLDPCLLLSHPRVLLPSYPCSCDSVPWELCKSLKDLEQKCDVFRVMEYSQNIYRLYLSSWQALWSIIYHRATSQLFWEAWKCNYPHLTEAEAGMKSEQRVAVLWWSPPLSRPNPDTSHSLTAGCGQSHWNIWVSAVCFTSEIQNNPLDPSNATTEMLDLNWGPNFAT